MAFRDSPYDQRVGRAFRAGCLVIVLIASHSPVHGQNLSTTLYVGAAPAANDLSAAVGLRVEFGSTWGGYARAALRAVTNTCLESLPPRCNYPTGDTREYAVGVSRMLASDTWSTFLAAGGGAVSWQGESDPFLDVIVDVRRTPGRRTSLLFHAAHCALECQDLSTLGRVRFPFDLARKT